MFIHKVWVLWGYNKGLKNTYYIHMVKGYIFLNCAMFYLALN